MHKPRVLPGDFPARSEFQKIWAKTGFFQIQLQRFARVRALSSRQIFPNGRESAKYQSPFLALFLFWKYEQEIYCLVHQFVTYVQCFHLFIPEKVSRSWALVNERMTFLRSAFFFFISKSVLSSPWLMVNSLAAVLAISDARMILWKRSHLTCVSKNLIILSNSGSNRRWISLVFSFFFES